MSSDVFGASFYLRLFIWLLLLDFTAPFSVFERRKNHVDSRLLFAAKGFGGSSNIKKKAGKKNKRKRLVDSIGKKQVGKQSKNKPFVKSEQDALLDSLASAASKTCLGQAVNSFQGKEMDPFWELMPSLINSRFPNVPDREFERLAGFVRHTLDPSLPLEDDIISNEWRPQSEIHAYMPGLGPTKPFHDAEQLQLCRELSANYNTIKKEYEALLQDMEHGGKDRFQSVTKSVPLAGRIAGFNRQHPETGIPLHSDGNNMWLTCQMGIEVPEDEKAFIRVGPETRHWKKGECLLYDTTYEHETMNEHPVQERVVLHVDFFNTIAMTPVEIQAMQYIYSLREEFMKAEGVSKVGAQIL